MIFLKCPYCISVGCGVVSNYIVILKDLVSTTIETLSRFIRRYDLYTIISWQEVYDEALRKAVFLCNRGI